MQDIDSEPRLNPYSSPTTRISRSRWRLLTSRVHHGWLDSALLAVRIGVHMFLVSFIAPVCGTAAYCFNRLDLEDSTLRTRLLASLIGGAYLLFFLWPLTIPLATLTAMIGFLGRCLRIVSRTVWIGSGAAVGAAVAVLLARWAAVEWNALPPGIVVGGVSGWLLRELWVPRRAQTVGPSKEQ
jgi:hypothetical protein